MAQILGIPRREAEELLRKGDLGFILREELPADAKAADFSRTVSRLKQLTRIHPAVPFYAGLLADRNLSTLLFCAALESSSLPARREAVQKLTPLILEAGENEARNILGLLDAGNLKGKTDLAVLRSACLYRLGSYGEAAKLLSPDQAGGWEKALALFAVWKTSAGTDENSRREIPAFLFDLPPGEIRRWAYAEALGSEGLLDSGEQAALSNRLSNRTTLMNLPSVLSDGGIIFFRYPELLADLGRAYQSTPAGREEGVKLFSAWDKLLDNEPGASPPELEAFINTLDSEAVRSHRYLLLYYSGRIERARDRYAKSSEYFSRALDYAPDAGQSDACLWYILMNTLSGEPGAAAPLVLRTMPRWNDASYFEDVLDRLSSYLTAKRQWNTLLEIFHSLEGRHAGRSLAQYAWILGRAVQEGYLKTNRPGEGSAKDFLRIAFEAGNGSFYYRAMAASRLGETFVPAGDNPKTGNVTPEKTRAGEMEFILGFFEYGAASFALPFIQIMERELSVPELRKIAEALAATDRWQESLNLISRYTRREDYEINREDLYLLYPRPFHELIEKYAGEMELGAEILYGLIRTESHFMPDIVSRSGAVGLAQLMAPTAEDMAGRIARRGGPDYRGPEGIDLKNPEINVHIGSYYLRYLTEQMGSPMLALLAYNGGLGRTRRWLAADKQQNGGGLPQDLFLETIEYTETREYGRRVLAAAAVYGYLYYGMSMEEVASDLYPTDLYPTD